jgi:diguanylate cyclase (GGDEF)-like protein
MTPVTSPSSVDYEVAKRNPDSLLARLASLHAHQILTSCLNALSVGIEIWDGQDRLAYCNDKVDHEHAGYLSASDIGRSYESVMRANLKLQLITAAIGREEMWLEHRLATRGLRKEPLLQGLPGDRWINTYETRTHDDYLVVVRIDVTELVRQGRALEICNQRLSLLSTTDGLTGLTNRRCFDELLTTEWQRACRGATPLSLLMIDIDYFKNYNDHYGHLAGDECLRRVANGLSQCVRRAGETVARYGGEEFVIILPGADLAHAIDTASKCLERMEQEAVRHAASPTSAQLTISIGVACVQPDTTMEAHALINAADAAMYRAKSNGRARCEVADQLDWDIDDDTPRTQPAPLS